MGGKNSSKWRDLRISTSIGGKAMTELKVFKGNAETAQLVVPAEAGYVVLVAWKFGDDDVSVDYHPVVA
jgi:hypothetical protein